MRFLLPLALVAASCTSPRPAADRAVDTRAVEAAVDRWTEAWQVKDAALAARDYADDAEWTNAFGQTQRGRAAIEAQLREVFALPFVTAGQSAPTAQTVRFLRPDVALVWTRVERRGQQAPSGEALGLRRTSHLRVFERRGGAWVITSHLISDARDTAAPQH